LLGGAVSVIPSGAVMLPPEIVAANVSGLDKVTVRLDGALTATVVGAKATVIVGLGAVAKPLKVTAE
jgi:hypothetical protein